MQEVVNNAERCQTSSMIKETQAQTTSLQALAKKRTCSPRAGTLPLDHGRQWEVPLPNVALYMAIEKKWALLGHPSPDIIPL